MKKLVLAFVLLTSFCFAQNSNNYKAVIVPLKFDFIRTNNQYRLCTMSKANLVNAGFTVFYANEILPKEYNDRCELLYYDIVKENAFLATKFHIELKDCSGNLIYKSDTGYTKEKDTELAYSKALDEAFVSVKNLHYKYEKLNVATPVVTLKEEVVPVVASAVSTPVIQKSDSNLVYAQATATGYQLVDASPKVIFKLYVTSKSDVYLATKGTIQGAFIQKDKEWFFEYYENEKLVSEKVAVKF
ncbi:hypothetical protein [Flavobacterium sp.]|uniref:hypothetical protein n=1 Tax=Flavobacterium sp. TaxID=239 RepID=UPI00286F15BD|nr:hypothetical protein [Flavobacterium sp.]